tara:strand:- start:387 stop:563 length:177 start_codon:yes stop_codon:yes gene_type:complete
MMETHQHLDQLHLQVVAVEMVVIHLINLVDLEVVLLWERQLVQVIHLRLILHKVIQED